MKRQANKYKKVDSSPGTRPTRSTPVRLAPAIQLAVDNWAKRNGTNRSQAIRRLIELGLAGARLPRGRSPAARSKAYELASKHVDKLFDPSIPNEERQQRKRRLLRGPREFREIRDEVRSKSKRQS
jgi:hypothetical protein